MQHALLCLLAMSPALALSLPSAPEDADEEPTKKNWNDLQGMWGKRGWNDLQGMWGKRGWNDLQGMWGKRGWNDMQNMWGKRGWNDLQGMWGKRGWNDMQNMWGKRGWNDLQGMWGKRGWNDLQGMWGKRNNWINPKGIWVQRTETDTLTPVVGPEGPPSGLGPAQTKSWVQP